MFAKPSANGTAAEVQQAARAAGQGEERPAERPVCLARKAGRQCETSGHTGATPVDSGAGPHPGLDTRSLSPAVPLVSVGLLLLLVGKHPECNRSSWPCEC